MPPQIQPERLSETALNALSVFIVKLLQNHVMIHKYCRLMPKKCKYFDELHDFMIKYIPELYACKLVDAIANTHLCKEQPKLRRGALQLLLNGNCSTLILQNEKEMRDLNYTKFKGLECVIIDFERNRPFTGQKLLIFEDMIYNFSSVTSLKIHMPISERMMEAIGLNCNVLKVLKFSVGFEELGTGVGFLKLIFADYPLKETFNGLYFTLYHLEIDADDLHPNNEDGINQYLTECQSSLESISVLVEHLFNLKVFHFNLGGHVLKHLQSQIRTYSQHLQEISDTLMNEDIATIINTTLPDIKTVMNFRSVKDDIMLTKFAGVSLTSLNLGGPTKSKYLKEYLTNNGRSIEVLVASDVIDSFNLSVISESCPKLIHLNLGTEKCVVAKTGLNFPKLEIFTLTTLWTDESLVSALLAMKKLKKLQLLECSDIRLKTIQYITDYAALNNLESILITKCKYLTLKSVTKLVSECPKLKSIGNLYDFKLSVEEIITLNLLYLAQNVDIKLIYDDFKCEDEISSSSEEAEDEQLSEESDCFDYYT